MNKLTIAILTACALVAISLPQTYGNSIEVTVSGVSGPWMWTSNGLNAAFAYGDNNQQNPTVISAADGLDFSPGNVLAVEYVGGLVYEGGGWPLNDADGALWYSPVNDSTNANGMPRFPSFYFDHADYPAFAAALVGTFSDSSGAIVGTPFKVGNFRYLTIPAGATRLQLGDQDQQFGDNSGSWQIKVSEIPKLDIDLTGHLLLHAPTGSTNRVEYLSDLGTTNWQTLTNIIIQQSPLQFIDPEFGQTPHRFYRAVLLQ